MQEVSRTRIKEIYDRFIVGANKLLSSKKELISEFRRRLDTKKMAEVKKELNRPNDNLRG